MRILQDHAEAAAQIVLADLVDIDAVIPDLTVRNVIEAVDEVRDRRLACARRADKGDLLARRRIEIDVMQNDLLWRIAEVHVMEHHVASELRIGHGAVRLMRMLPRPHAGALLALGQRAVRMLDRVDKGHIALIRLGLLIEQPEHALRTGHGHNDGVQLLADLRDGLVEAAVERHERRERAERQTDIAMQRQRRARHDAQYIADVAELGVDRHEDVCVAVGAAGAVAQLLVELVEALDGGLLVVEDLHDLLALHHFLDVAVNLAEVLLLPDEELAGLPGDLLRGEQHQSHHDERQQRQRHIEHDHADEHAHDTDDAGKQLRQTLADELAERVDIVRVDGHDVAVGMRVEIRDRQALHMAEELFAEVAHRALRDIDHQAGIAPRAQHADGVDRADLDELVQQGREVRAAALQHGGKVAVIELLQEQRAVQLGQHRQDDADHDGKAVPFVVLQDEGHGAAHGLAGILRPFRGVHRAPAGAAHRFRRHIMHPPSRRSRRRPASGPDRPPDRCGSRQAAAHACRSR